MEAIAPAVSADHRNIYDSFFINICRKITDNALTTFLRFQTKHITQSLVMLLFLPNTGPLQWKPILWVCTGEQIRLAYEAVTDKELLLRTEIWKKNGIEGVVE